MSTPENFEGPFFKIERAERHLQEHSELLKQFVQDGGFGQPKQVKHPSDPRIHVFEGIELTKPLPSDIRLSAADALYNLRSGLDQAVSQCAILSKGTAEGTYFPHGKDLEGFKHSARSKCGKVPREIRDLLFDIEPYYGGKGFLFRALHDLNIIDKHTDLIKPSFAVIDVEYGAREVVVARQVNKGGLLTEKKPIYKFHASIVFSEIKSIERKPVFEVISELIVASRELVNDLSKECAKLGLC